MSQRRFILPFWVVLALLLAWLPNAAAPLLAPAGQQFMGSLINPDDHSVYLAAIRQGAEGNWLFHFNFSPEPIPPRLTYLFYLLLGRLLTAVSPPHLSTATNTLFHVARLLAGLLLLWVLWVWAGIILPRWQQTAWLLAVFGGGLGWLLAPLLQTNLQTLPDLGQSEWGVLLPMLGTPHFALGLAAETLLFASLYQLQQTKRQRWGLLGAVCSTLLGLLYPYNISVAGLVAALYLLAGAVQERRLPRWLWGWGSMALLPLLPLFAYYAIWARQDPNWEQTHVLSNVITSPTPPQLMAGLGLIGLLGLVGLWHWLAARRDPLLPIWAIANVLVLYLPLPFAGRFLLGLTIPWVTLAAFGLETAVLPHLPHPPATVATIRRILLILTTPSTMALLALLFYAPLVRPNFPLFLPEADLTAVAWLAPQLNETDLVLSHYPVGNTLPRYTNGRVFIGQPFLTLHLADKLDELTTFWAASPTARQATIARWGITYIYVGTVEKARFDTTIPPPGELVYDRDGVKIYQLLGATP